MLYNPATREGNKIFYSVRYSNKDVLRDEGVGREQGLPTVASLTEDWLWTGPTRATHSNNVPDTIPPDNFGAMFTDQDGYIVRDKASSLLDGPRIFMMDIEYPAWWTTVNPTNWVAAINTWRSAYHYPIGVYSTVPWHNHTAAIQGSGTLFDAWQAENDNRMPIVNAVDALYPECYTYTDNLDYCLAYITNTIAEAKRLRAASTKGTQPIYAMIQPVFPYGHASAGQYIGDVLWKAHIQTVLDNADGVIIWGWFPDDPFSTDLQWWKVLEEFM